MADLKEINAEKFKENLIGIYGESNKVNILYSELVRISDTKKNPFFYSAILNYIENDPQKINDLVDSKSTVNIDKITQITKPVEEQYRQSKEAKKNDAVKEKINDNETNFEEQFQAINFDKLTSNDFGFIANNFGYFMERANHEEYNKAVDAAQEVLGTDDQFVKISKIAYKLRKNEELTEEEKELVKNISDEYADYIGLDKANIKFDYETFDKQMSEYYMLVRDILIQIENGQLTEEQLDKILAERKDLLNNIPGIVNKEKILEALKGDAQKDEYINQLKNHNEEVKNMRGNVVWNPYESSEEQDFSSVEDLIGDAIDFNDSLNSQEPQTEEKSVNQMQEENEQYIKAAMDRDVDPANILRTEQESPEQIVDKNTTEELVKDEEAITEPLQEEIEPEEQTQDEIELEEIMEEKIEPEQQNEELEEEEYEAPTFEEEKTGIAGIFATIANSRFGRAVQNLFKPKEEQKKLNAAVNQRTEDGVKITEYESNGSLMPSTIQARNFLRDFAVNTVEAVTNFANNISNAIRGNKEEEVINKPTIIKSESVQEPANKVEQHVVEKTQEKAETYMDSNQWAVSKEALEAQAQKNTIQATNVQNKTQEQNKDTNEGIEY